MNSYVGLFIYFMILLFIVFIIICLLFCCRFRLPLVLSYILPSFDVLFFCFLLDFFGVVSLTLTFSLGDAREPHQRKSQHEKDPRGSEKRQAIRR